MISASDGAAASRAPMAAASRHAFGSDLGNCPLAGMAGEGGGEIVGDRIGCEAEDEIAGRIEPHHPLVPAAAGQLELPDGDGVEELVGDENQGTRRNLLQPLMPGDPAGRAGEGLTLQASERRAELHKMNAGGRERRPGRCGKP